MTLKEKLERGFKDLIEKHQLAMGGEPLTWDVYQMHCDDNGTIDVVFNDENMAYLLAGYVSCSIFDEMEQMLALIGYQIIDSDGSRVTLEEL